MTDIRKAKIKALLKGIETGDEASVAVVNPDKYIQHNPQTHEGGEGLAVLFKRLSKSNPRVNIVRIFSDGDFVFGHTEYDFSTSRIGFEIFRFEGDMTVEHWDNIQLRKGPNQSGRSMVDGGVEVQDKDKTESNRSLVNHFVSQVLIDRDFSKLEHFITEDFIEHNPHSKNGLKQLKIHLSEKMSNQNFKINYQKNHRLLAEGNFVLSVSEGTYEDRHSSFFDLFRIDNSQIVEHWDTLEKIPPRSEWKNDNGKF